MLDRQRGTRGTNARVAIFPNVTLRWKLPRMIPSKGMRTVPGNAQRMRFLHMTNTERLSLLTPDETFNGLIERVQSTKQEHTLAALVALEAAERYTDALRVFNAFILGTRDDRL